MLSIEKAIEQVTNLLSLGADPKIIKWALLSDGIPSNKVDLIIRWGYRMVGLKRV